MANNNAGEQTQIEKLDSIMKSLGLFQVWESVKTSFQSWSEGNSTGRKSFTDSQSFRRTGYSDPARQITTDMQADISLDFNKTEKGVFFNSYTVDLKNSIVNGRKPEQQTSVKDTFDVSFKKEDTNLTIKKALNLLDGRSVMIAENTWIKRSGKDINEYKFDVARAIKENTVMDFSQTNPDHMEKAVESLQKGDFAMISCEIDSKMVTVFLTADAQYKKVEANDSNLYRHLSQAEKDSIEERMNQKQDQAQGNGKKP